MIPLLVSYVLFLCPFWNTASFPWSVDDVITANSKYTKAILIFLKYLSALTHSSFLNNMGSAEDFVSDTNLESHLDTSRIQIGYEKISYLWYFHNLGWRALYVLHLRVKNKTKRNTYGTSINADTANKKNVRCFIEKLLEIDF